MDLYHQIEDIGAETSQEDLEIAKTHKEEVKETENQGIWEIPQCALAPKDSLESDLAATTPSQRRRKRKNGKKKRKGLGF